MLKAPLQLSRAYGYLGNPYKTDTQNTSLKFNNQRVTKKALLGKATLIENEIHHRFRSGSTPGNDTEIPDAIYIPTVLFRIKTEDFILFKKSSTKFYIDSRASAALIYRNQKPVFVDSVLDSNANCILDAGVAYFLKQSPGHIISLIKAAKKISSQLFFLEFAGLTKYQRSFLGYFDCGNIKFIGMRFGKVQLFDNIDRLIDKVFGSKIKYQEIIAGNNTKDKPWYKTIEKSQEQNLFDFLSYKIGYQTNSSLTVAKLIDYTAQQVSMTQCQRQILRYNLKNDLAISCDRVITDINYTVYQSLIIDIIYKTLTSAQFDLLFSELHHRSISRVQKLALNYKIPGMNISMK